MKVGTKLAITLLAPLLVVCLLAAVGVLDRSRRASNAGEAQRLAELTNAAGRATRALEVEQLYSAVLVGTKGESGTDSVLVQYGDTEGAIVQLSVAVKKVQGIDASLDARLADLATALGTLTALRADVGANRADIDNLSSRYKAISEALVQLVAGVPAVASIGDLAAPLNDAALVFQGVHLLGDGLTELAAAAGQKEITGVRRSSAIQSIALADRNFQNFDERAEERYRAQLTAAGKLPEAQDLQSQVDAVLNQSRKLGNDSSSVPLSAEYGKIRDLEVRRLDSLLSVQQGLTRDLAARAAKQQAASKRAVQLYLLGAGLGIALAAIAALSVASSIVRPLRRLTAAAKQLANEDLPALVERLRSPEPDVVLAPRQIAFKSGTDEVGQLAKAFDAIQQTTLDVAKEQAGLLRKGISDIFINLARRNQTLLDRQIEFIDQLEARETDPDQLQSLFRLDHLATRMRRNAESLLVLAGAEPARRRGRPVGVTDVVRVALGEVEDYTRITLLSLDEVRVPGNVAVDLSHVLAELMDNATQFSPPQAAVEVIGHHNREGGYVLSVSDQGIGMTTEQLADANSTLANPPLMGLSLSRSLGFVVISRLAARHRVGVRLAAGDRGGVTALISLPSDLLAHGDDAPRTLPERRPAEVSEKPVVAVNGVQDLQVAGAASARPTPTAMASAVPPPSQLQTRAHHEGGRPDGNEAFTYYDLGEATGRAHNPNEPHQAAPSPLPPPPAVPAPAAAMAPPAPAMPAAVLPPPLPGRTPLVLRQPAPEPERPAIEPEVATVDPAPPLPAPAPDAPSLAPMPVRRDAPPLPNRRRPLEPAPQPGPPTVDPAFVEPAVAVRELRPEPVAASARIDAAPRSTSLFDAPKPVAELRPVPAAAPANPNPMPDAPAAAPSPSAPVPNRQSAGLAGSSTTAAGLARRSPKAQLRDLAAPVPADTAGRSRATASQRSPEEVRRMLSRYRTGLQQGRVTAHGSGESSVEAGNGEERS